MATALRPPTSKASASGRPSTGCENRSSSWSAEDDETLITARAQGLNWNQIAPKHLPSKSANACRKRHERLIERDNADQWDGGVKFDQLALAYFEVRRDMWKFLADRAGEKWQLVESKCFEKGLKNLAQANRSALKSRAQECSMDKFTPDSGIALSDSEDERTTLSGISEFPSMVKINTEIPSTQPTLQCPGPNPFAKSELPAPPTIAADQCFNKKCGGDSTATSQRTTRKRNLMGRPNCHSAELGLDIRSRKRPRRGASSSDGLQTQQERKTLACPYFKHDPQKYRNHRSCRGPLGWDAISRLKEHLYRQHTLRPQCLRCCEIFKDETQLEDHQRSTDSCTRRERDLMEGLGKRQIDQLKDRKIMFRAGNEEEKWIIIYLIIFPDTPPNGLPSPYYDDEVIVDETGDNSPKPPELAEYEAYMNRELPRKVRKELEVAIEKLTGPIEETLKNQLENLIRNCQERLSRDFLQTKCVAEIPQPHHEADGPIARACTADKPSDQTTIAESSIAPQCAEASNAEVLAQYDVQPDIPADPWSLPLDASYFGHTASSDSGYIPSMSAALPSDPWWTAPDFESLQYTSMMNEVCDFERPVSLDIGPSHTGKGKERVNEDIPAMEWDSTPFLYR